MALTPGEFLELLSSATSIIDWLWGISDTSKIEDINVELAKLDIEYIKSQTAKEITRLEEAGEAQLGTMRAVIGHSAAKLEGTPLYLMQEQAQITQEDILEVEAISEHAIAGLELQLPYELSEIQDIWAETEQGKGKTFLTGYKDPFKRKMNKMPHFGR